MCAAGLYSQASFIIEINMHSHRLSLHDVHLLGTIDNTVWAESESKTKSFHFHQGCQFTFLSLRSLSQLLSVSSGPSLSIATVALDTGWVGGGMLGKAGALSSWGGGGVFIKQGEK